MSAVCASPLLWRLVDLNVLHDQIAGVEALGIRVGLGVLEQAEQELGGLDGPAGFGDAELFACNQPPSYQYIFLSMHPRTRLATSTSATDVGSRTLGGTASAPGISPHWDGFAMVDDVLEVGDGAPQLPPIDRLRSFACIFEGCA